MKKFVLNPNPTFKAVVQIPVPGKDETVGVEFTFRHRTRDEFQSFLKDTKDLRDAELIKSVAVGWELAEAFTDENINILCQNYYQAPGLIYERYLEEQTQARRKN